MTSKTGRPRGRPRKADRPVSAPAVVVAPPPSGLDIRSIPDAAKFFGVSRWTIEAMIKSGALPCIRLSERRRRVNVAPAAAGLMPRPVAAE